MVQTRQVMTDKLHTIEPEATLQKAARIMKQYNIGILPVITGEGKAVGTITDRDITIRGVAEDASPSIVKVREMMSPGVEFCYGDDDIERAARHMAEKKLRRLIVVTRENRAIEGIVSLVDVATRAKEKHMAGAALAAGAA